MIVVEISINAELWNLDFFTSTVTPYRLVWTFEEAFTLFVPVFKAISSSFGAVLSKS
jgi:hypothetical protein